MKQINQDILTIETGLICHQVNTLKVMGAGLALQIALKWPHVKAAYKAKTTWSLGDFQPVKIDTDLYVGNLAGQDTVGFGVQRTHYPSLAVALELATVAAMQLQVPLYIPHGMGCGLAGGEWSVVLDMIERIAPKAIICKLP